MTYHVEFSDGAKLKSYFEMQRSPGTTIALGRFILTVIYNTPDRTALPAACEYSRAYHREYDE